MKTIVRPNGGKVPEGYPRFSSVIDQEDHRNLPGKGKRSFNKLGGAFWWRKAFFKRYRRKERIEIAF